MPVVVVEVLMEEELPDQEAQAAAALRG